MKANVQYNDFVGSAAADISDHLGSQFGDDLKGFGKYFDIDEKRYEVIGISIYGTDNFFISLLCIDRDKSNDKKEHVVKISMEVDGQEKILDVLFKRLCIVLHSKFETKYYDIGYDEEIRYSDLPKAEKSY